MSPRNFARRFKEATGDTPLAYSPRPADRGCQADARDHATGVAEVGQKVGYLDPAFFRQLFQRKAGISPSEYRRRFGRMAAERRCPL
jgi:transcriptional regulator GlxA family with amidase domain